MPYSVQMDPHPLRSKSSCLSIGLRSCISFSFFFSSFFPSLFFFGLVCELYSTGRLESSVIYGAIERKRVDFSCKSNATLPPLEKRWKIQSRERLLRPIPKENNSESCKCDETVKKGPLVNDKTIPGLTDVLPPPFAIPQGRSNSPPPPTKIRGRPQWFKKPNYYCWLNKPWSGNGVREYCSSPINHIYTYHTHRETNMATHQICVSPCYFSLLSEVNRSQLPTIWLTVYIRHSHITIVPFRARRIVDIAFALLLAVECGRPCVSCIYLKTIELAQKEIDTSYIYTYTINS